MSKRALIELGWEPRTSFEDLIREMVDANLEMLEASAPVASA
jgi:GDP-D-mannose dehydratase